MYWWLIVVMGLLWTVYYRFQRRKIIALSKRLPGDLSCWPIVGHALALRGNNEEQMKTFQKTGYAAIKRGGMTSYWVANRLYIMVADPEVYATVSKSCLEKDNVTRFLQFLIGNGSIYAAVQLWRPRRKLLAPTFSMRNLNRFVEVFAQQSRVTVEQLRPNVRKGTFSIWKYLTTYTFEAVCETTLGVQMNSQRNPSQPFLEALEEITQLMGSRMVQPWLYADCIYSLLPQSKKAKKCKKLMYDFVKQVIQAKRQEIQNLQKIEPHSEADTGTKSFLQLLLESSDFTDLELLEETMVMTVAGTDTSAVAASFTAVMLSRHPEIQDRVYGELQGVFGESDRAVSAEDLPRLKLLEAVVKETLRMYPPVPVIVRSVHTDTELPSGLTLVKGVGVVLNIWAMHRNPRYWVDPDVFNPDRFLEPLRHPAQFVPFSYGLRNCLGYQYAMMSIKTVLASVIRQYRVLPQEGADPSNMKEPLRVKFDVMMKDVDRFQIQLEHRNNNNLIYSELYNSTRK